MMHLKEYILEGGNAVAANPIPAYVSPIIYKDIENKVKSKFPSIEMAPLGSIGKKNDDQFNGDIDIAIKIGSKEELVNIVKGCFPNAERNENTMSTICSISYPYSIEGQSGNAQIDFMIVKNIDWAKFYYWSPNFRTKESKYKGAMRTAFLAIIISEIPIEGAKDEYFEDGTTLKKHWKYTFNTEGVFKQLVDFTGKNGKPIKNGKKLKEFEELVANDPQNVMKFVFGDNATIDDMKSTESLWKAVHDPNKFIWQEKVPAIEDRFYKENDGKIDKEDFKK